MKMNEESSSSSNRNNNTSFAVGLEEGNLTSTPTHNNNQNHHQAGSNNSLSNALVPVPIYTASAPASGPGKYLRRLNEMEAELTEWRNKVGVLEGKLSGMEEWRRHVDNFLLDAFAIRVGADGVSYVDGEGNNESLEREGTSSLNGASNVSMDPSFLVPKTELIEGNSELVLNGTFAEPKPIGLNSNGGADHGGGSTSNGVGGSPPLVEIRKRGRGRPSTKTESESKPEIPVKVTSQRSGSAGEAGISRPIMISSNVTLEITKQTPTIQLQRCDEPQPVKKPVVPGCSSNNESVMLNDNDVSEKDEISIVFASPPPRAIATNRTETKTVATVSPSGERRLPKEVEKKTGAGLAAKVSEANQIAISKQNNQKGENGVVNPAQGAVAADPTPCSVCGVVTAEPHNAFVFCEVCNVCVHQCCYGIRHAPPNGIGWKCNPCGMNLNTLEIQCYLCPELGGALKPLENYQNQWAHVICALIPEVKPLCFKTMQPIVNAHKIDKARWKLKCSLCKIQKGACIQCQFNKRCTTAFHVTCAMKHGLEMKEIIGDDPNEDCCLQAYCKTHTYFANKKGKKKRGKRTPQKRKEESSLADDIEEGSSQSKKKRIEPEEGASIPEENGAADTENLEDDLEESNIADD